MRILKLLTVYFLLTSCQKKDDPAPAPTTGQALFWTASQTLGGSYIDVTVDGKYEGRITQFAAQTPACGANGFVTVTKTPGTFSVSALGEDGISFNGSVTIIAGTCSKLEFTSANSTNGQVIFWTQSDLGCGNITVKVGSLQGIISAWVSSSPACNTPNMPTFSLAPGTYNYMATCVGKNASGSFSIQSGVCLRYQLK